MVSGDQAKTRIRVLFRASLLIALIVGSSVSAIWLTRIDLITAVGSVSGRTIWTVPLLLCSTALSMAIRFLRWHFLLRVNALRVPTRDSLRIYLAGFAMVLTPAHVGEIVKALLLRWRHGLPLSSTVPIVVGERLFDIMAIILIVAASLVWLHSSLIAVSLGVLLGVAVLAVFLLVRWAAHGVVQGASFVPGALRNNEWLARAANPAIVVTTPRTATICLLLSLASWLVASVALILSLASFGIRIGPVGASYAFAYGTAFGAFSLLPAGVGVAGSMMILELVGSNVPLDVASTSVVLARIASVWFAVAIGVSMLAALTRRLAWPDQYLELLRFDQVAPHYEHQIPPHLRQHILDKKLVPMLTSLDGQRGLLGVDLGCGQGWYATELARRSGHRVVGVDYSKGQIGTGAGQNADQEAGPALVVGDMLDLPFQTGKFDFIYSINAFHHIGTRESQTVALAEVARILKPNGRFFLHEMNAANPLLCFYLSYLFPLVRSIDEGTELWLDPRKPPSRPGMALAGVQYFTFMPDFLPRWLLRPTRWLESRLETGRLRTYSVHYMAEYVRLPGESEASGVNGSEPNADRLFEP